MIVAEHDPDVEQLLVRLLERSGRQVSCYSERGTVPAADSAVLLIVDPEWDGGKGLQLAQALQEQLPDLAVLVVSAVDSFEERQLAQQLRKHLYLGKPFSSSCFEEAVSCLLDTPS